MSAADRTPKASAVENAQKASAVALAYAAGDSAPRVVAKGRGLLAEEILRRARGAGIPVHASRELVSLLMQVDLDRHVPPELYRAVAELLAWLYRLEHGKKEKGKKKKGPGSINSRNSRAWPLFLF